MLGPVMMAMQFFLLSRIVSLATKSPCIICSTTGCLPSLIRMTPLSFNVGRTYRFLSETRERLQKTSRAAIAFAAFWISGVFEATRSLSFAKASYSRSPSFSLAFRISFSVCLSSGVV